MKRSPLKPGKPPSRRTELKRVNRKRKAEKFARNFYSKERVKWFQAQPSEISGKGPCVNAHTTARGMGGSGGGYKDIVPLTALEHLHYDEMSKADFEARHGRTKQSIKDAAPKWHARWLAYQGGLEE